MPSTACFSTDVRSDALLSLSCFGVWKAEVYLAEVSRVCMVLVCSHLSRQSKEQFSPLQFSCVCVNVRHRTQ